MITEMQEVTTYIVLGKKCDICGTEYLSTSNTLEFEEMIRINHSCGFGSKIGDGFHIDLDICQSCFIERVLNHVQ